MSEQNTFTSRKVTNASLITDILQYCEAINLCPAVNAVVSETSVLFSVSYLSRLRSAV